MSYDHRTALYEIRDELRKLTFSHVGFYSVEGCFVFAPLNEVTLVYSERNWQIGVRGDWYKVSDQMASKVMKLIKTKTNEPLEKT